MKISILDDWFDTDALKGALGAAGILHLLQGPRSGGTALRLLHHHVGCAPGIFRPPRSNIVELLGRLPRVELRGTEVLRIAGPMFFGVAGEMLDALNRIGRTPHAIILRLDRVPYLDSSGVNVLETFVRQAKGRGLRVILCDMPPRVRETLTRATPRFAGAERVRTLASAITRLERMATTSE